MSRADNPDIISRPESNFRFIEKKNRSHFVSVIRVDWYFFRKVLVISYLWK